MNRMQFCRQGFVTLGLAMLLIGVTAPSLFAQPSFFKVAFIGDQGLGEDAEAVLRLIKREGAQAVVHLGDFDYEDDPQAWEDQINKILGPNFPYFACVGNHDENEFYGPGGYQEFMAARMNRLGIGWSGDLGVQSNFTYNGVLFVMTAPGVFGSGHDTYIRDVLAADNSIWSISNWHKDMKLMQVGGKSDETGWGVYEESRKGGAIIATAHEHSYSRTHLLSSCQNQTVASTSNTLTLTKDDLTTPADEGNSFVFVSGLGGKSVRDQELSGDWWASIYTGTQGASPGALFGTFGNGAPNRATFYFKDTTGVVPDNFVVISNVELDLPIISSFSPTNGPHETEVTITGNNFTGATQVKFNNIAAAFSIDSNTQIRATVPAGATTGKISVTGPDGTATSTNDFTVTFPPSISSFTPASGPIGTQITISGENFSTATQVTFNNVAAISFIVDSNTQIRANVPAGATTGRIHVTAMDGTATSSSNFTVTFPPSISSFTPTNGLVGTQVTIIGNNFTGATLVNFNGVAATTFNVVSNTEIRANVPAGATTGKISVTAADGTATSASDFTVTIPQPPTIASFTPNSGPIGTSVTITGNNFTGATQVTFNNIAAAFSVDSDTQIRATVSVNASTGRISVTAPGGEVASADDFTVTLPEPPTISSFTPTSGPAGTQVTITGNNFFGTTQVTFNNVAGASFIVDSSTQIRANVPAGATTGKISVTAPGGEVTSADDFMVTFPPSISSFSPTSGLVGAQVTIAGNNFASASQVSFNNVAATTFTIDSNTQIRANVPVGATTGRIRVTVPDGTAMSANDFTVLFPPSISSFAPTSGPAGTQVTIIGNNFLNTTQITFNNIAATTFTIDFNTQIRVTVPAGATTGRIRVTAPGGTATSANDFTVLFPPSVSSFAPAAGPIGAQVTITGANFTGTTQVSFNNIAATSFTVDSNTQIRANVPAGATPGRIRVTTPGGTGTSAIDFNATSQPVISSFTPTQGPVGTQVTINGHNLAEVVLVNFNGVLAANLTIDSNTQIRADVPFGATSGKIDATSSIGTGVSPADFSVSPSVGPTITSFTPTSGFIGTSVTITGSNFFGVTQVTFNGVAAASFNVDSDTQIRANVPSGATTGNIEVTASNMKAKSLNNFTVNFLPSISSFTPASGLIGTQVIITGNYFTDATQVTFNNVDATSFFVDSNTQIRANVPNGATTGRISVSTPSGTITSVSDFTVTFLPSISSFTPASGLIGIQVTITGNNFSSATQVMFNNVAATTFTVNSDTQIRANVPAGATTGKISVSTPTGTITSVSDFTVTFLPSISSFTPASGLIGTQVTITGNNFTGATQVAFNGVVATTFIVDSNTQIRANVPTGATTGKISVSTPTGTITSVSDFTVTFLPSISSFTPASGLIGTQVTIIGNNFSGATQVMFNNVAATTFTVNSDTQIRANVPAGATTGKISVSTPTGTITSASDFTVVVTTGINSPTNKPIPEKVVLEQNYPNPFNPLTSIAYSVPKGMRVMLKVYNLAGKEVAVLVNGYYDRGNYTVTFDAAGLPSGVYLTALQAGAERRVHRILYMK